MVSALLPCTHNDQQKIINERSEKEGEQVRSHLNVCTAATNIGQ